MSSRKRKIAGTLALSATVTGAISSGTTSAGLFDWFRNEKTLNKERKEKQEKGYNTAIQVAKNIHKIIENDKENNNSENNNKNKGNEEDKKLKNNNKEEENKSILKLMNGLISDREKLFLKNLGVNVNGNDELEFKKDISANLLNDIENYFEKKFSILRGSCSQFISSSNRGASYERSSESKGYHFFTSEGSENNITIKGDTSQRINVLKKLCDDFVLDSIQKRNNESNLAKALINIAEEDMLRQYDREKPEKPLLNLSYEDIIKHLIENTMKDGLVTYRDDFYKIFETANNKKKGTLDTAATLHELG